MLKREDVIKIIDEVMNNREIDSIRNAILAIRDKVNELQDDDNYVPPFYAKLEMRGNNGLENITPYFEGAKYVCIDTSQKIDTGIYGAFWYE